MANVFFWPHPGPLQPRVALALAVVQGEGMICRVN